MYRILARQRERARAAALRNRSIDAAQPVAGPDQEVKGSPAQAQNQLNYSSWHAALAGHNDGRPQDSPDGEGEKAAPSIDFHDLVNSEADAA